MTSKWDCIEKVRDRVTREWGPPFQRDHRRIALAYPSPYRAGMSSLGFQWIFTQLRDAGLQVERVFLPDKTDDYRKAKVSPFSYETETPLGEFPLIGISLAYELEIAGLIELLELSGIPPLRADRGPEHPRIILGGPLTFSNPLPAAPFVDVILMGEAEETTPIAALAFFDSDTDGGWHTEVKKLAGAFIPGVDTQLPLVAKASDLTLPARSSHLAGDAELSNMFLIEGERGCHRECTFCVMRRSTNGGMRLVSPERILSFIPDEAKRVGLVGAAISDHPKLPLLLQTLVDSGRGIGVSSLRADRVSRKPQIARILRDAGARTLTVASDAATQNLRRSLAKGNTEKQLIRCAEIAHEYRYDVLKVYMMLGVPGEVDEDIDELIAFTNQMGSIHKIALGVAPFVAKRNTPLDQLAFAGIATVERRIKRLQKGLNRKVATVRPTSARWAWVEYQLAQGDESAGIALLEAVHNGGRFSDYKRAFAKIGAVL